PAIDAAAAEEIADRGRRAVVREAGRQARIEGRRRELSDRRIGSARGVALQEAQIQRAAECDRLVVADPGIQLVALIAGEITGRRVVRESAILRILQLRLGDRAAARRFPKYVAL